VGCVSRSRDARPLGETRRAASAGAHVRVAPDESADLRPCSSCSDTSNSSTRSIYLHLSQRHLQAVANPLDAMPVSGVDMVRRTRPPPQAVTQPPLEVADIVRRHGDRVLASYRAWLGRDFVEPARETPYYFRHTVGKVPQVCAKTLRRPYLKPQ
jgi:hypothetical protein